MSDTITIDKDHFDVDEIFDGLSQGKIYLVTKDGKTVARIAPPESPQKPLSGARERLLARLASQPATNAGPWTREELYEDD